MKDQQKYIKTIIVFVAVFYAFGQWIESFLGKNIASYITSVGTISAFVYGLYLVWDNWLWKYERLSRFLSKIVGFYEYPVLNGKWKINYESSFDNGKKGEGEAQISQKYSSMFIEGDFGTSSSFESFFAQLKQKENGKWFLIYAYRNKPHSPALTSSVSGGMHEGFANLDVINRNKLIGYYANDENRKTRGKIVLTRMN